MPERVGPFQRVEVTQYDEAGLNLSAGYNRLPGEGDPWPIAATVCMQAIVELTETLVPPPDGAGTPSHPSSETETPNSPELFASGTASRCLATS